MSAPASLLRSASSLSLFALAVCALGACGVSPEIEDAHDVAGPTYEVITVPAAPVLVMTCPPGERCVLPAAPPPPAPVVFPAPPPPPMITAPAISAAPGVPPDVVRAVVGRGYGKLQRCYEKGLRRNPMLEGVVVARVRVDGDGEVDSAKDAGSTLPDRGVVKCVLGAIEDIDFPEGGRATIVLPIRFAPHA